ARAQDQGERKRRVHAKSRKGCGNCKLRRVKCDEQRPQCKKCKLYGVECNYGGLSNSLQIPAQGSFQINLGSLKPVEQVNQLDTIRPQHYVGPAHTLSAHEIVPFWHFSEHHLEILARFRDRTALTIGDKSVRYAGERSACETFTHFHAFLMHMLLGLTLMHDADLTAHLPSPLTSKRHKHAALTHWNTATKLFARLLSRPVPPHHRDAVWATGVIIGAASFWFVNSVTDPYAVWPLKPHEPADLNWLRLGEGKRMLWKVADPTRPESVFYGLMKDKRSQCNGGPDWLNSKIKAEVRVLDETKRVFGIDDKSTIKNNPYHLPLLILSRIQHMHLTHANVVSFLYVTAFITPELLELLEAKDVRAVFILGWWFKMIANGEMWWMTSRAKIEGQAVRIWLEREDEEY
ncbi:hypothetical protein EK21DRAFT_13702, partial [Setomelanomma holmii]